MKTGIVAFLVGILSLYQFSTLPDTPFVYFLSATGVLLILYPRLRLIGCFATGFLWALWRADIILENQLPVSLEGKDILLEATVATLPHYSLNRVHFSADVETLFLDNRQVPASYRLNLNWYKDIPQVLEPGQRWRFLVRLKRPNGFMNPGGQDYEAILFENGISATGYVRSGAKLMGYSNAIFYRIHRWRTALHHELKTIMPGLNGIIPALALGIRDDLTQAQWKVLIDTGTIHLVAISGLHISLIAGLAFFIGRWLWSLPIRSLHWIPAQKAGAMISIIAALGYAALAGFSIPTQRAVIMITSIMLCLLANRHLSRSDIFFIALFIVLLFSPDSVIVPGFWLSFAAVAIIFYSLDGRTGTRNIWSSSLKVHFALAIGLAPVLALFFGKNPVYGPLTNLFAVPIFGLIITPLALLGTLFLPVTKSLSQPFIEAGNTLINGFWPFLQWFSELQFATIHTPPLTFGIFLIALLGVLLFLMPKGLPGRWLGGVFVLPALLLQPEHPATGEFEFTLLDVGQGLAAVIRTAEHTLVYDTGARYSADFDTGRTVVVPFLRSLGIESVDRVIISHGDNDHRGGYRSLVEAMQIGETLTSVPEKLKGDQVISCQEGQEWEWDVVHFEILHPYPQYHGKENNRSCVLLVRNHSHSLLLPGDIEKTAEEDLVRKMGKRVDVDVLVAPHHGSKTSSSDQFIESVSPGYVLFPVGYRNRYNHPAITVIKKYRKRDIKSFDTARDGAIQLYFGEDISIPVLYRVDHGHFWNRDHVE